MSVILFSFLFFYLFFFSLSVSPLSLVVPPSPKETCCSDDDDDNDEKDGHLYSFQNHQCAVACVFCRHYKQLTAVSYGVVSKGLLTFLGSLYKEVAKTTSGTLVYLFERQTIREKK